MWILVLLVGGTAWLAWSNGANDNFKGAATLYGSRTLSYRGALTWASITTVAGSLTSVALAHGLVRTFSGVGLVAPGAINDASLAAVGIGAGATVLLATVLGMPTSTTHAMTGALVGAALVVDSSGIDLSALMTQFARPLLLSPVLAILLTSVLYMALHWFRRRTGVTSESCVCIGSPCEDPVAVPLGTLAADCISPKGGIEMTAGTTSACVKRYAGRVMGIRAQSTVDTMHFLSAGAVCFARAVNDTPKIAALLLSARAVAGNLPINGVLAMVTLAVTLGGVIQSRRVAETMSRRITDLNTGQGLTANLVTALLVLGASRLGLPVSTTHVSCGAIFGIGVVTGKRNARTIRRILAAWVTTLPLGMLLGAGLLLLIRSFGV
ncbi:MAG: inorganic phosphate transporter [Planctomycetes bacterium]|nr:inorganic phosphate transporter [Planctomycetota bacterium]